MRFGSFLAKAVRRPITNLLISDKGIQAPVPVTLPPGHHPVTRSGKAAGGQLPGAERGKEAPPRGCRTSA